VPLTLKVMVSAPAAALVSVIAWRNDPAPLSFRFVTVNVAARAGVIPMALKVNASKARMTVHDFVNEGFICISPLVLDMFRTGWKNRTGFGSLSSLGFTYRRINGRNKLCAVAPPPQKPPDRAYVPPLDVPASGWPMLPPRL
jgi:hypothetical protein